MRPAVEQLNISSCIHFMCHSNRYLYYLLASIQLQLSDVVNNLCCFRILLAFNSIWQFP
uniref:Uncharacterized protein n=1 Tax=Arundo donax TaxID=35708 RepID=A0A0A9CZ08_ARUDO